MSKIWAMMVTKDEEDRYLDPVLKSLTSYVDGIFVYDDRSKDSTVGIASSNGAVVRVRNADESSFAENESAFRSNGLRAMLDMTGAQCGDWVLTVDADEMFAFEDDPRSTLEALQENLSVKFRVAEVFDVMNDTPYIRVDGFWKDIDAIRYFQLQQGCQFPDRKAPGSVPTYALRKPVMCSDPVILHYGYARHEDRIRKYARYVGASGHNPKHVDSILRSPTLIRWDGQRL